MVRTNGYSLIELLVVVGVSAITLGMIMPNTGQWTERAQATAFTNQLIGNVHLARQAAVHHHALTTLCPVRSASDVESPSAIPQCGTDWRRGYWLFVDRDGDAVFDADADYTLWRSTPPPPGIQLTWRAFRSKPYLQFTPSGVTYYLNGRFTYCTRSRRHARIIVLNSAGRARVQIDDDGDGRVDDAPRITVNCA